MGTTLTQLTSATEKFNNGTLEDKKQVLSALGSNRAKRHPYPILTDGRLSLEEYFWLQPIKKDKQILIDKLEKVRTAPGQIKKRRRGGCLSILVRVQGVGPWSHPWEGYIIAVIRYPRLSHYITPL